MRRIIALSFSWVLFSVAASGTPLAAFEDGTKVLRVRGGFQHGPQFAQRTVIRECDPYVEIRFDAAVEAGSIHTARFSEVVKGRCEMRLNPALRLVAKEQLVFKLKKETDACGNTTYTGRSEDKEPHHLVILDNRARLEPPQLPADHACVKSLGGYAVPFRSKGIAVWELDRSPAEPGIYRRFSPASLVDAGADEKYFGNSIARSKELAAAMMDFAPNSSPFTLQHFAKHSQPSYVTRFFNGSIHCSDRRELFNKADVKDPVRCTLVAMNDREFEGKDIRVGNWRPSVERAVVGGADAVKILEIIKEAGALKQGFAGNYDLFGVACLYDGQHYAAVAVETPVIENAYCAASFMPKSSRPLPKGPLGASPPMPPPGK